MGKTINVSGFLHGVSTIEVRQLFESIIGSGTIHPIRFRNTQRGGIFYVLVQFTQEAHVKKLLTGSTEVSTPYRLNFYECKYEMDSKDKASVEHNIDSLLMYFGYLESAEKLRYMVSVCGSFGIGNHNLHFSAQLSERFYHMELPYENVGQINWDHSQEEASKLLLIKLKEVPNI